MRKSSKMSLLGYKINNFVALSQVRHRALEDLLDGALQANRYHLHRIMPHLDQLRFRVVGEQHTPTDGAYIDLREIDRREHILESGGHQFQMLSVATEIVHDDERRMLEVIGVDHLLFAGRNHIPG